MEQNFHEMGAFQFPAFAEFRSFPAARGERLARPWLPPVDISETDSSLLLKVEVPGIKAEDLQVGILEDPVVIRGEAREEKVEEKRDVYRRTPLPESIKAEGATAGLKHGVLNLQLPKLTEKKGKRIPVQTK